MYKIGCALTIFFLVLAICFQNSFELKRRGHKHRHHRLRPYNLTFTVRNFNLSEAKFFQLRGTGHTIYFRLAPRDIWHQTFQVQGKGIWVLYAEFGENFYAMSRKKIISRDSYKDWSIEAFSFGGSTKNKTEDGTIVTLPGAVGFSDWEKGYIMDKYYR